MRVVTPAEMAEIDRAAIKKEKIPGLTLMERAGERAAAAAREMMEGLGRPAAGRSGAWRVAIWCGKGNNGGDGLVAARHLANAGVEVEVFLLGLPKELSGDAVVNFELLTKLTVSRTEVTEKEHVRSFTKVYPPYDLLIDAIFGTGFKGRAEGVFADAIEAMNSSGCPILSVDIPSGVAGDTGAVSGPAIRATKTVTFAYPKVGLVQYPGVALVGEMEVADIGIPPHLLKGIAASSVYLTTPEEAEALLPGRAPDAHKRQCGSVLVVGGSPGLTGAAALAAQAALRSGAGLVTLAVPEALQDILEVKLTEVMTHPLPQGKEGALSLKSAGVIAELSREFDVVAMGPGLSTKGEVTKVVRELVTALEVPLVLDADGLNAMIGRTSLFTERQAPLVLTPHPGEMARLAGSTSAAVQADRIAAVREGAEKWGAVVVLKGAGTLVAAPGGTVRVNTTGNPGMATAGMGDVLTGCIASFFAQGLSAFDAATAGVYYHGHAADLAARMDGMVGMLAGDVIRHLPLALKRPE
ncbi:MAG: NAD(P)H-hydrate dehydratase [Actinobacteria bacterium]|nr:NAD(P)H-hydrate dehydratase [Actinomycetota bacterium]